MAIAGTLELPQLTPDVHQTDLWMVSEADRELGVYLPLREANGISRKLIELGGGVFNDEYLQNLDTIQNGMGYQVDFHSAREDIESFTSRVGDTGLEGLMLTALDKAVETKRATINEAIESAGRVFVRIRDPDTNHADGAYVRAYYDRLGEDEHPEYVEDYWRHPGQRVGRVVTCEALDEDSHFTFVVEGKSGASYSFRPRGLSYVIIERGKQLLEQPVFPIRSEEAQA